MHLIGSSQKTVDAGYSDNTLEHSHKGQPHLSRPSAFIRTNRNGQFHTRLEHLNFSIGVTEIENPDCWHCLYRNFSRPKSHRKRQHQWNWCYSYDYSLHDQKVIHTAFFWRIRPGALERRWWFPISCPGTATPKMAGIFSYTSAREKQIHVPEKTKWFK